MSHIRVTVGQHMFIVQGFIDSLDRTFARIGLVERRDGYINATTCADDVFQRMALLDIGQPWRVWMNGNVMVVSTNASFPNEEEGCILEGTKVEIRQQLIAHLRMMQAVMGDTT